MKSFIRLAVGVTLAVSLVLADAKASLTSPLAKPSTTTKAGWDPKVVAMLDSSTAVYKKYKTYQHTAIFTVEMKAKDGIHKRGKQFTIAIERPNKFRFASSQNLDVLLISDGKWFYNYHASTGEYTKAHVGATLADIDLVHGVEFQALGTYLVALMLQGNATANTEYSGILKATRVEEPVLQNGRKLIPLAYKVPGRSFTFYFDAKSHRLEKLISSANDGYIVVTELETDVKIDQPILASLFTFTPPEDAKLVARFTDPHEDALTKALIVKYEGKPAPDFTAKDLNGKEVTLSSLKGKVVVLNFWASWSGGSRAVLPFLQEIHEKYSKDVTVLTVDTQDQKEACLNFLKANPTFTLSVLLDPAEDDTGTSIARTIFGVRSVPATIILDKEGIVRTYTIGSHERSFYLDALKRLGIQTAVK